MVLEGTDKRGLLSFGELNAVEKHSRHLKVRTRQCGCIQSGQFNHQKDKCNLSSVTCQNDFLEREPLIKSLERYYSKHYFMLKTKWDIDFYFVFFFSQ